METWTVTRSLQAIADRLSDLGETQVVETLRDYC